MRENLQVVPQRGPYMQLEQVTPGEGGGGRKEFISMTERLGGGTLSHVIEAPHPGGSVRVAPVVPVVAILSPGWEAWMDLQEYGSTTRLPGTTCSLCSAVDCRGDGSSWKLEGRREYTVTTH